MLTTLLNVVATVGFLVTLVSADTYYIISTDSTTCPIVTENSSFPIGDQTPVIENAICLTLTQFAELELEYVFPQSITLMFVPGHHILGTPLWIKNVTNLILQVVFMPSDPVPVLAANVTCTNSSGFIFEDISEVAVSGLVFSDCRENSVRSLDQLRIENCTFQNGHGMELRNAMNVTIERSYFISLTAFRVLWDPWFESFRESGGAVIAVESNLLIIECLFELNRADDGGAIWLDSSSISVIRSNFNTNTAGGGGAIITFESSIHIHASNFTGNTAYINGGAIETSNSRLSISGSDLSGNTAEEGGGAITIYLGSTIINGTNFNSNTADIGGAVLICSDSIVFHGCNFRSNTADVGGAIRIGFNGKINIHGSLFSSNTANMFGGAIETLLGSIHINGCDFSNNSVEFYGGAIWTDSGSINIYNSSFSKSMAVTGGAIETHSGSVYINSSNFSYNTVESFGGAISTFRGNITIHDSVFHNNTAIFGGGAIRITTGSIDIYTSDFSNNMCTANFGGALSASSGNINVNGSRFTNNRAVNGGAISTFSGITINSSNFSSNTADNNGGGVFLDSAREGSNEINNSIFNHNFAFNQGGAIYVQSKTVSFNGFLQVTKNSAMTGVVFALQSTLLLFGTTTISYNEASFYAFNSNVTFNGYTKLMNNSQLVLESVEEGGALTSFQSDIVFTGTVNIMYNTVNRQYGGAILCSESKIYMYGQTTISHNTALAGGGIYTYQSELNFNGRTRITDNAGSIKGGGVYAVGSAIKVTGGQLRFIENRAERGGGICFELNSKLYVMKALPECSIGHNNPSAVCRRRSMSSLRLYFTKNSAQYGGAVFISDNTNSGLCATNVDQSISDSSECFYQDLALHSIKYDDLIVQNAFFAGNSASILGAVIYGGLLDRCAISPYSQVFNKYDLNNTFLDAISYLTNVTDLKATNIQSQISSKPVRVCFCTSKWQPDCDNPPPVYTVKKGEMFSISLVAVDQVRNPITTSVRAFLSSNLGGLAEGQDIQHTITNCTELNFTITSPHDSEQLVLYADGPCSDVGISQTRVNVTFLPCICPIGFVKTMQESTCSCECDPCLHSIISGCLFRNSSVQRKDNIWISYINETIEEFEGYRNECHYLTYPHCPFDYCYPSSSQVWIDFNTPSGPDAQCAFNRTGKLCGSCKYGLSLTFGGSHCMSCSNNWLGLIILFVIGGIALVALILVCNLTVAVGTINGLIFYANILATNRATFFPFQKPNFLTIFVAWLNLEFGLVACFFDGMDDYAKEWLQLAIPIYNIFMVTMVIIACEYSTRIAKVFSHTNPVATLATLILLSYAKSLRVIIAALSSATLDYPDGSRERVWLIDANINYFEGKHIPLFLVALLILLVGTVYTSLLFSYQWLQRCPNRRALKWLKDARFYPFMDAYLAPYNLKHRYWTGLLLLIRAFLYVVVATVNVSGDPGNNLLLIICILACLLLLKLLLPGRIYKSWPLDALETLFIFNIMLFSVGSLYIRYAGVGNQETLAYTSTSISFITFLLILMYHSYAFVLPKKVQNKFKFFKSKVRLVIKKESNEHEVIKIADTNVCTYTEVDGIPHQHKLDRENAATIMSKADANLKLKNNEPANLKMDSLVPSQQTTDITVTPTLSSEVQISKVAAETGIVKDGQQGAVNIELQTRPTFAHSDYHLDPYIRDSDELGMERANEIMDFIEVTHTVKT